MPSIDSTNQWQLLDRSSPGNVYLNIIKKKHPGVKFFLYSFNFYLTHVENPCKNIFRRGERQSRKIKIKKNNSS